MKVGYKKYVTMMKLSDMLDTTNEDSCFGCFVGKGRGSGACTDVMIIEEAIEGKCSW